MLTTAELIKKAEVAELRKKWIDDSIPLTQAAEQAAAAAAAADEQAKRDEAAAAQAAQAAKAPPEGADAQALATTATQLRATATESRAAATTAREAADKARIKADIYQENAMSIGGKTAFWSRVGDRVLHVGAGMWLALVLIVGGLAVALIMDNGSILDSIGVVQNARAMIMVLIIGATLLVAIMLCYQACTGGTTEVQFRMAREIYTTLIGVVGTVVGFYFATPSPSTPPPPAAPLTAVALALKDGDPSTLIATLTGGRPPYQWEMISNKAQVGKSAKAEEESPFELKVDTQWQGKKVMLKVTDADGKAASSDELPLPPAAPPGQDAPKPPPPPAQP